MRIGSINGPMAWTAARWTALSSADWMVMTLWPRPPGLGMLTLRSGPGR